MMQEDALAVGVCGFKAAQMNNFLYIRTNIIGLEFG